MKSSPEPRPGPATTVAVRPAQPVRRIAVFTGWGEMVAPAPVRTGAAADARVVNYVGAWMTEPISCAA